MALFRNNRFIGLNDSLGIKLQGSIDLTRAIISPVDKQGNLWIACLGLFSITNFKTGAGVLMYDGENFHVYDNFLDKLGKQQLPIEVYCSKNSGKIFLTTGYLSRNNF